MSPRRPVVAASNASLGLGVGLLAVGLLTSTTALWVVGVVFLVVAVSAAGVNRRQRRARGRGPS